ncbi:MAG: LysE family translocator [Saprospiraceae bacterium]|nr:LysE family translocator [Saprospiraceae bacterium]
MDVENILSFIAASVILTVMPGPDNIFVLIESITKGHKTGMAISTGLISGILIHTIIAATGLSILLRQSDIVFTIIKFAGSAYLFYLAFKAYKENLGINIVQQMQTTKNIQFFRLFRKGFLMNVLNPKVTLFFIAFLPQFVSDPGINIALQMIIMGFIFMGQAFVIFFLIALMAGKLADRIHHQAFRTITRLVKVVILSILGITLFFS